MSFRASLPEFSFLSELYKRDAPETALLTEYPSSNNPKARYRNTEKFIIHDPFPPPDLSLLEVLGPHHLMCCWGGLLPVTSEVRPPERLLDHWTGVFGQAAYPDWQAANARQCYTALFPHESLPADQQEIDPATLYVLHSKEAIGEIDCPQPAILDKVAAPCVVKLSHGYASLGNFFIRNTQEKDKAETYLAAHWPGARTVTTALIEDIAGDYGVQFYLAKNGTIHWLGFTNQLFDKGLKWSGGTFSLDEQDALYPKFRAIAEPVAAYLHRNGYYGLVGIDILINRTGDLFLVDLNPRLTGITPFLLAARILSGEGYTHGIYTPSIQFSGTMDQLFDLAGHTATARILILSVYEDSVAGHTTCHLSVHGKSLEQCQQTLNEVRAFNM